MPAGGQLYVGILVTIYIKHWLTNALTQGRRYAVRFGLHRKV